MNEISKGADLVMYYGEISAGYKERGRKFNPEKILNEGFKAIELTKEDLVEGNGYTLPEINTIRKWFKNKS